jgi:hypothetical protein
MTLDNSKTIISLRIKFFGATIVFIAYFVLAYAAKIIKFPLLGRGETFWIMLLTGIYAFLAILPMILNYQFVFFSDDSDKIVFRYFTSGLVGGKKNAVEIDKRSFGGYTTESRFFGLIQSITLSHKFREGVAKYPPIYISALPKKDRAKVFKTLNLYTTQE